MPAYGISSVIYGGEGDDVFDTDYDQMPLQIPLALIYGGAGNDKITSLKSALSMRSYGGDGDDKIILGGSGLEIASGGDGNDIIYGTEIDVDFAVPGPISIYGDSSAIQLLADESLASIGGDDKIYGGDGLQSPQSIYAGPGNDFVSVGSNSASTVLVHGDNPSVG